MSTRGLVERSAQGRRKRNLAYALVGMLAVSGLAAAVIIRGGGEPTPPAVDLDRSRGDASAPVVVEEYGDFQ